MSRAAVFLVLLSLAGCGAGSGSVVRVVDGREVPGRYVSHHAYAAFARGALLEARGDLRGAASAYGQALEQDSVSAEIWTRLGALRCQLGANDSDDAFERAERLDSSFEPLWRERARCHLRRREHRSALKAAERAFAIDPNQTSTSLVIVTALERVGRIDEALRWSDAIVAREPSSESAWSAAFELASRRGDIGRRERARQKLAELDVRRQRRSLVAEPANLLAEVDRALAESSLTEARRLAYVAHLPPSALALRAAALGKSELAREQAAWVLAANSSDADAWIAALVAADREHESDRFVVLLQSLGPDPIAPAPLAIRLFTELLARRSGVESARHFLGAHQPLPPPADPLEAAVVQRLSRLGVESAAQ